jgi:hypothetical protein
VRINYDAASNSATFTPISFPSASQSPHPDTPLAFDSNGDLIVADDGGLYALTDPKRGHGGRSVVQPTPPIRAIDLFRRHGPEDGRLAFAAQTTGACRRREGVPGSRPDPAWGNVPDGDGFTVAS